MWFLGPIINTSVFSEFSSKNNNKNSIPAYNCMSSRSLFTCEITQDLTIQLEIVYKMRKVWFGA